MFAFLFSLIFISSFILLHLQIQLRSAEKRENIKEQPQKHSFPDLLIKRGLGGGGLVLIAGYHQKILKSFQIHFATVEF